MPLLTIAVIAVALAMDAFAVAIAAGAHLKNISFRQTFRLSWHFGLFQAMMPVLGWSAGLTVRSYIEAFDHWLAFGLLAVVGVNMIRESISRPKTAAPKKDPTKGATLVILSVATSIDALAVGLGISVIHVSIWAPALIIGIVAGTFTLAGLFLGGKIGSAKRLSGYAEIIGGIVLLAIGLKILWDHGALDFI